MSVRTDRARWAVVVDIGLGLRTVLSVPTFAYLTPCPHDHGRQNEGIGDGEEKRSFVFVFPTNLPR